jgi:uncharacterized protein
MKEAGATHFAVDIMLGKLAKWLRILGFDTRCESFRSTEQLNTLRSQGYRLLTRNGRWSGEPRVLHLGSNDVLGQLREVVADTSIHPGEFFLFQRCLCCNELLERIEREKVSGSVPDFVYETHLSFHRCPNCQRLYWPGSHSKRVEETLEQEFGWRR